MKFKYQGKIYSPSNLEKKLRKMGITMEDIEILPDEIKKEDYKDDSITKYYFTNIKTGYTIVSIYPTIPEWVNGKDDWTFM